MYPKIRNVSRLLFSLLSDKTCVVGTHLKRPVRVCPLNTHNNSIHRK